MKTSYRVLIGILAGGALGLAFHFLIGCRTGACPITGNIWISTMYGAVMGLFLATPFPCMRKSCTVPTDPEKPSTTA